MTPTLTRRRFLQASIAAAGLALAPRNLRAAQAQAPAREFAFVLLGDLHLDRPEHHDMDWVRREKPNDVRQIEGYCRNTHEVTPKLFAMLRPCCAPAGSSLFRPKPCTAWGPMPSMRRRWLESSKPRAGPRRTP